VGVVGGGEWLGEGVGVAAGPLGGTEGPPGPLDGAAEGAAEGEGNGDGEADADSEADADGDGVSGGDATVGVHFTRVAAGAGVLGEGAGVKSGSRLARSSVGVGESVGLASGLGLGLGLGLSEGNAAMALGEGVFEICSAARVPANEKATSTTTVRASRPARLLTGRLANQARARWASAFKRARFNGSSQPLDERVDCQTRRPRLRVNPATGSVAKGTCPIVHDKPRADRGAQVHPLPRALGAAGVTATS
jgi:hypothetical protein